MKHDPIIITRTKVLTAAALLIGALVLAFMVGNAGGDEPPQQVVQEFTCTDGQWSDATIAGDENHGPLSSSIHADLSGTTEVTGSGGRKITTHDDGRVEGEGGELTVTCVSPTHKEGAGK